MRVVKKMLSKFLHVKNRFLFVCQVDVSNCVSLKFFAIHFYTVFDKSFFTFVDFP